MRKKLSAACLFAFTLLLLYVVVTGTAPDYFTEDFTSKQYCDTLNTTAQWDTISGELKLWPFELSLAGSYDTPGYAQGVAISGNYAYVADYTHGLQVIDISDPTSPSFAGSYDTPGLSYGLAIAGDYAYVADHTSGLQVIDISYPTSPSLAGSYTTPDDAWDITLAGDYAYMACAFSGLQVIDISDPTNPSIAGSYDTPGFAIGVAIAGDYAYVADGSSGLQVIDISDPTSPSLAGSYDTPGYAYKVAVSGDYCYVAGGGSGLQVIDISDPTSPSLAGSYDTPGNAFGVNISGDYAYIADSNSGLQVINISDPTSPSIAGNYDTPYSATLVTISGNFAFVSDGNSGLQVIDICDSTDPSLVGSYDTPNYAEDVAISGDYAYVADYYTFQVINITDPTNPSPAGSCSTPSFAYGVTVSGDYAYVADGDSGFQVIDISDPVIPSITGNTDTPGSAWDVAISGDYAYVADYDYGLQVIDINDPTSPSLAGSYDTPGSAWGVAISGDYAYVADGDSGLQVIDISDPMIPSLAGTFGALSNALGVAISGDYAYVADGISGLQVIDISDPTSPSLAGSCNTTGYAYGVTVTGDYAYMADYNSGLQVIDISDPTNPSLIGTCDTPGYAFNVGISGDYAYVADSGSGLQVIWIFQRYVNTDDNTGQSVQINSSSDDILAVKLATTQTDTVQWEVSANGGTDWQEVLPGTSWNTILVPGNDLRWRSTHVYFYPIINPTCSELVIYQLGAFALIDSITDIGNDQGREVSIEWTRSGYDHAGSPTPILEYAIYRKIDYGLTYFSEQVPGDDKKNPGSPERDGNAPSLAYPPGDWDYVTTVPANCEDAYAAVVSTLADSTITEGMYYTTFFVRAITSLPAVYFDSPSDSGYSVDNLAPGIPMGFAVAYNTGSGNELSWEECLDGDFQYFRVYRSESDDFEPDPGNLVHMTIDTNWLDTIDEGWRYFYKITAVDFSGNESEAASAGSVTGDDMPTIPGAFALYQNVPNPFNPATTIRYDLPVRSHVRLAVYNVKGQLVRVLLDGDVAAGGREIVWDGTDSLGRDVASGIYFYRITAGRGILSRKMVLLK